MALLYSDLATYVKAGLLGLGYSEYNPNIDPNAQALPLLLPGLYSMQTFLNRSPGPIVFLQVGNGAGEILEQTYDQVFITVRVVGQQGDYDFAERLAHDVDRILHVNTPTQFGEARVLYVARTGGAPELVDYDDSDRYHFQATYITPASTGL